jgi:hypothetical protein
MKQQIRYGFWMILAGIAGPVGAIRAGAAQAGAWETFYTQKNADAWSIYDFADGEDYPVDWSDAVAGVETASTTYFKDNAVAFWTDVSAGGGAMVGDYPAVKIAGLSCDVYLGDLATLDYLDCSVFALGPAGPTKKYYYSAAYFREDFREGGWWILPFSFDDPWYYWNETAWVPVDARTLTAISSIDFTFYPMIGSAGGSRVGIDNVTLDPTVVAPKVATTVTTSVPRKFQMSFTPGPGLACQVEKMRMPPAAGWDVVPGQTEIVGPAVHVYLDPMATPKGIFRVAAEADYRIITTP